MISDMNRERVLLADWILGGLPYSREREAALRAIYRLQRRYPGTTMEQTRESMGSMPELLVELGILEVHHNTLAVRS